MKTICVCVVRALCIALMISVATSSDAQNKIPRNYAGVSGIAELHRLSIDAGVEYERWFFAKDQFALGAKAHYIFPSKTINYIFSPNEGIQRSRQFQVMATSYFFTGSEQQIKGFFISLCAGINFVKWEGESYDGSGNTYVTSVNEVSPGLDVGIGAQTKAGKMAFRFTAGYQMFPGNKYSDFVSANNISQLYLKFSLGF